MRRQIATSLILILLSLQACSDDGASPNNNGGGGNGFTVISLSEDSVYWREHVTITFRNATSDSFKIFVHTATAVIDSVWRDGSGNGGVRFYLEEGTASGNLRIFTDGKYQEIGELLLYVIPKTREGLMMQISHITPERGYVGDPVIVWGIDLPLRRKDVDVLIDGVKMPIESLDSTHIMIYVSDEARTGPVHVRMFDRLEQAGYFERLEHGATLLPEATVSRLQVHTQGLRGTYASHWVWKDGDTTKISESLVPDFSMHRTFDNPVISSFGDSIICASLDTLNNNVRSVEVRLKREPESRVSGVIRTMYRRVDGYYEQLEMHIKKMRWKETGSGAVELYTTASTIEQHVTLLEYTLAQPNGGYMQTDTYTFEHSDPSSSVSIVLMP